MRTLEVVKVLGLRAEKIGSDEFMLQKNGG
jgi:hypothetical protein